MRPTVDEMLAAVRWTIEEALLPEVTGPYARFQALIAVDLLDLIGRQWAHATSDAIADIGDYRSALERSRPFLPADLAPDLKARIDAALNETAPPLPPAWPELVARVDVLSGLADALLESLQDGHGDDLDEVRGHLRSAARTQLERVMTRHAGLDIRR